MKKATVLAYYNTGAKVAKALGVTRQCVSAWPDIIPELYALRLEKTTNGGLQYDESLYRSA